MRISAEEWCRSRTMKTNSEKTPAEHCCRRMSVVSLFVSLIQVSLRDPSTSIMSTYVILHTQQNAYCWFNQEVSVYSTAPHFQSRSVNIFIIYPILFFCLCLYISCSLSWKWGPWPTVKWCTKWVVVNPKMWHDIEKCISRRGSFMPMKQAYWVHYSHYLCANSYSDAIVTHHVNLSWNHSLHSGYNRLFCCCRAWLVSQLANWPA